MRHPLEPRDVNSTSWSPLLGLFPEPCAVRGGDGNCQTNAFRIYTRSPIFNLRLKIPDHCRIDCEQSNLSLNMTSPLKKGTEGSKPPVTSVQDTWQCWKESSWLLNIDISNWGRAHVSSSAWQWPFTEAVGLSWHPSGRKVFISHLWARISWVQPNKWSCVTNCCGYMGNRPIFFFFLFLSLKICGPMGDASHLNQHTLHIPGSPQGLWALLCRAGTTISGSWRIKYNSFSLFPRLVGLISITGSEF